MAVHGPLDAVYLPYRRCYTLQVVPQVRGTMQ